MGENNMENIKVRLKNYESDFNTTELGTPLVLIAEILMEISEHLDNIVNKVYE